MNKLRAALATGALAAVTLLPAAPAQATHACTVDDDSGNVRRLCESHPDDLLYYVFCLLSNSC